MTEQHDNASSIDPLFQPFVEQWVTCAQQANEATTNMLGGFNSSPDPRAWRQQWFEMLGGNTDAYLRSPPFLQVMKTHIDALVQAKKSHPAHDTGASPNAPTSGSEPLASRMSQLELALQTSLAQLAAKTDALDEPGQTSHNNGWDQFLSTQVPPATATKTGGTTPHEVVYEEGSLRLLRYTNDSVKYAQPILICFALVNRPYILDLQGDRSVVRQLLDHGFDVYMIDWGTPRDADRDFQLQDYVCRFMKNVVDYVCQPAESPQLNLLGYCMGGTLSTMFTALYPEQVRNLILMATPIDFEGDEGMLNLWAGADYFNVDQLIDAYGNCPGEFLRYCFLLMKPVQNLAEKYLTYCERLDDDAFLENFFAMERWASDSVPVAGETFRQFVKWLYQQNRLVRGQLSLDGKAVRLDQITCPLLMLVAKQDHLVPPSSTLALAQHVSSTDVETMSTGAGHIGLAVSRKAHSQLWPAAAQWIADHSTAT